MKIGNVLNCSFSYWYPQFRQDTIESRIIPLPQDFIDYLLEDGIVLPSGSYVEPKFDRSSDDGFDSDDESKWEQPDDSDSKTPSFPELEAKIKSCIEELGGKVFPKLNWSSPKDAKWISADHTLQCVTVGEVLLLLKSSDFISHDLTQPFKDCEDLPNGSAVDTPVAYELVLRKWTDVNPGTEFRCFVRNGTLIAISQRDYTNFYDYIVKEEKELVERISKYYKDNIYGNFQDLSYCFDIYFPTKDCINVIDFNPFGETTDALLFDWDYLIDLFRRETEVVEAEFRCVSSYDGIQPSPYRYYAMPVDMLHISTGQDPYKMTDFLQLMRNGSLDTDENDNEES